MGGTLKIKNRAGEWVDVPGLTGKSAYEIAKKYGFEGTEEEWLASLKPSPPDWSENDETSDAYIKNRTHYDCTRGETMVLHDEGEEGTGSAVGNKITFDFRYKCNHNGFEDGSRYEITFDGKTYTGTIDNANIVLYRLDDWRMLEVDFQHLSGDEWDVVVTSRHYLSDTSPRNTTLYITPLFGEIKLLDPKFIPDYVSKTYVDAQHGEAFYDAARVAYALLGSEISADSGPLGEEKYVYSYDVTDFAVCDGEKYEVTFDGITYISTAVYMPNIATVRLKSRDGDWGAIYLTNYKEEFAPVGSEPGYRMTLTIEAPLGFTPPKDPTLYIKPFGQTKKQIRSECIPDYVSRTYVDEVTADIRGDNTKTIADGSIALGINTTAGRRGYYIKSVDTASKKMYLSAEQVIPPKMSDADNTDADFPTPGYDVGDYISIIAGSHYYFCAKIAAVQNNVITYDGDLGFKSFSMDDAPDGYTLSVPSKPEVGVVTLGASGFVAGEGNLGNGRGVLMGGRDNVGSNYASVGGRGNTAGYGVGVFGTFNFIPGLGSFGGGNKNEIWGRYCGFSGNQNYIAPGVIESVIEGLENRIETSHTHGGGRYSKSRGGSLNTFHGESLDIEGSFNDVEGRGHKVRGDFNFVRGDNLIACGNQAVLGAYNIEDADKLLIIGGGTAKERKNILTIDRKGNINGANLDSMQAEIDSLHRKMADLVDFAVYEVMEGLTEEVKIAPRFSFFGAYYRVLADNAPIEEVYTPIGEALRTAHGALWAENVQIALYGADKQETMRCRLKLAHEDVNTKYGHLERVV